MIRDCADVKSALRSRRTHTASTAARSSASASGTSRDSNRASRAQLSLPLLLTAPLPLYRYEHANRNSIHYVFYGCYFIVFHFLVGMMLASLATGIILESYVVTRGLEREEEVRHENESLGNEADDLRESWHDHSRRLEEHMYRGDLAEVEAEEMRALGSLTEELGMQDMNELQAVRQRHASIAALHTQHSIWYKLTVKTADMRGAGTQASVSVRLRGHAHHSELHHLHHSHGERAFGRGATPWELGRLRGRQRGPRDAAVPEPVPAAAQEERRKEGGAANIDAALAEAGVAAVGWRTDCSDAGAALFAAAFYKRAFDQADAVADPNIAPAASAFLGATQDVLAPRAAAFVAQAPRSPACPTRGGGGSVENEAPLQRESLARCAACLVVRRRAGARPPAAAGATGRRGIAIGWGY